MGRLWGNGPKRDEARMPRRHTFRKIQIFDHGLGNLPGHWPNFHRLLVEQSRKFGLDPLILGFVEINRDLIGDLPVRPFFRFGPAACMSPDIVENNRLRNLAFLDELNQLDIREYTSQDIFLFTFVMNYELEAILRFSATFPPAMKPVFLVLLQFDNGMSVPDAPDLPPLVRFDRWLKRLGQNAEPSEAGRVASLYRRAFTAVRRRSALEKLVFMAPSGGLDLLFSRVLGREVHPYCMPWLKPRLIGSPDGRAASEMSPNGNGTKVCFLGHSCMRKGLQFMPTICSAVRSHRPDVTFDVQVNYSPEYPLAHVFKSLFDKEIEGVTYHSGHLENEQYFSILNSSDIVLFPYDADVYRYMPSGLLREAVAAGKVLVIPDGTSLSRQAMSVDAGAVSFKEFTAEAVVRALNAALAQHDSLRRKAQRAAARWAMAHNPDLFMEQLLEQASAATR